MSALARTAHVAVGSLGGTIAMTAAASGGATPTLGAEDLLAEVPGLADVATVSAETLKVVPGASLTPDDVLDAVRWAEEQVSRLGASGVVLVQGTDTIEETAYLASLYWALPEPLVFTGAMRPADTPSSDGAANLLAACQVAAAEQARGAGVVVVMDHAVHAAETVYKSHTFAPSTMRSRDRAVRGSVVEGRVQIAARPAPEARVPEPRAAEPLPLQPAISLASVTVPLVTTYLGDTGELIHAAMREELDGLVIAGFGVGHVPAEVARRLDDICSQIPVVYASRVPEGAVGRRTYDFVGSEMYLQRSGAIPAGILSPPKARLLLAALLASGVPRAEIPAHVERRAHV